MKRKLIFIFAILTPFLMLSTKAQAEDLVITGNGSDSSNTANVSSSQTTNVSQNNTAEVNNTQNTTANTGSNAASGNTGDNTSITTGDVHANSSVDTSVNSSSVKSDCGCASVGGGTDSNVVISGNGADSTNNATVNSSNSTNVAVNQNATVTNNITGSANTGKNTANNNNGSVAIDTGNIYVSENLINKPINVTNINTGGFGQGNVSVIIISNGTNSVNNVTLNIADATNLVQNNSANILNNISWNLNTGGNIANGNVGDVSIITGDIAALINVENGVNVNNASANTCKVNEPGTPPIPTPEAGGNNGSSSSGSGGSSGGSGGGSVLAAAIGPMMLPITGNIFTFLMTIASIVMFFLGWYLRLASGNAPPKFRFV